MPIVTYQPGPVRHGQNEYLHSIKQSSPSSYQLSTAPLAPSPRIYIINPSSSVTLFEGWSLPPILPPIVTYQPGPTRHGQNGCLHSIRQVRAPPSTITPRVLSRIYPSSKPSSVSPLLCVGPIRVEGRVPRSRKCEEEIVRNVPPRRHGVDYATGKAT